MSPVKGTKQLLEELEEKAEKEDRELTQEEIDAIQTAELKLMQEKAERALSLIHI